MPLKITMPRLSDTMEEGTLLKWRVASGDSVESGDHLADVETDKATMELQAFDDGTVAKLAVDEGQTVPVGDLILILAEAGESAQDAVKAAGSGGAGVSGGDSGDGSDGDAGDDADDESQGGDDSAGGASAETGPEQGKADQKAQDASSGAKASGKGDSGGTSGGAKMRVSSLARKLADEHDVDLGTLTGSGPDGRIIKRDVLEAAKGGGQTKPGKAEPDKGKAGKPQAAPVKPITGNLEAKSIKLTGMRKTIAKRLVESKQQVPHFQVSVAVRMDELMALRKTLNAQLESQGIKLSVNDFVTRAIALACIEHPQVNASWAGDTIEQHGTVNVGTAISLPAEKGGGLLVATLRDAHLKGLRQISAEVRELAKNARGEKGLTVEQLSDSTITISNLGMPQYGVTQFNAILNPPNAAIIAVGATLERPVVKDGTIAIGQEMNVTLSGDHRVIDGAIAAEYLTAFKRLLENPAALLV